MRPQLLAATAIATLLLAGCSTADSQESTAATAPPVSSTSSPSNEATASAGSEAIAESASASPSAPVVNSGQAWADARIQMWVDNSGIKSTAGFLYPYNLMTSWDSPEDGVIDIKLSNDIVFNRDGTLQSYEGPKAELGFMGSIMFESIGEASPELETVTFSTEDGKHSGSFSRGRTGADPANRQAWADEKYAQWLNSMNDTYESFCGTPITSLKVYRSCIPNDPHAYVDTVESPAKGELVVSIADGPWMGDDYDIPASRFVSSNMLIRINEKAVGEGKVDKLTVIARNGEDTAVEMPRDLAQ